MPLIKLETSAKVSDEQKDMLLTELSKTVSDVTGKPETYVMSVVQTADIILGGNSAPAAFVDIRGIGGMTPDINKALSASVCELLSKTVAITGDRIYLNFTDVPASNWGWNSSTFG